ncbi:2Fe-2S iron-sulfur cluster-binding protein [Pelomicrobium sp. G1]|uniref:2Fe-2S iron-sulfur cluster-binding protein n=1 Tax=unclassified Pelomicrobium TaxID=2815318 RepID=UPI003F774FE3
MKVQVNARNRAYQFECAPGEKILFAGLRNAVDLPYECGSGTCGTCKAKLIEGEIHDPWPQAPGTRLLKSAQGEFLMCQCEPKSDLSIEVANFVYYADPGACIPAFYHGRIESQARLTHDVLAFRVALDAPMDFDAGQFVLAEAPAVRGFRGYSMVNFERRASRLEFVVKKKPGGGFSEWLFDGSVQGAELRLFGPLGKATFYPGLGKNVLCIAGGSGIAGMMSILSRGCQERYFSQYKGYVFFGVRSARDVFYLEALEGFRREFPDNLEITVALSDEPVPQALVDRYPGLAFDQGLVHEVAARRMEGRYQNVRAYLAGPPPAVEAAIRMLLLKAKLTTDNIRYDKFS